MEIVETEVTDVVEDDDASSVAKGDMTLQAEAASTNLLDARDEEAAIGDVLSPSVEADTAAIAKAQRAMAALFSQPEVPLQPTQAARPPKLSHQELALLPARLRGRLATKPQMPDV